MTDPHECNIPINGNDFCVTGCSFCNLKGQIISLRTAAERERLSCHLKERFPITEAIQVKISGDDV